MTVCRLRVNVTRPDAIAELVKRLVTADDDDLGQMLTECSDCYKFRVVDSYDGLEETQTYPFFGHIG